MRTVLRFRVDRPWSSRPPCCAPAARARRALLLLLAVLLAALALTPRAAPALQPATPGPAVVAEALFLCDPLPPGGRDLNLSLAAEPGGAWSPRLQVALALGDRLGLTADVGVAGETLASPGASLKLLLRDPADGGLGVATSLDLLGAAHSLGESEVGLGLGLLKPLGPVTLRAGASVASPLGAFAPHLHAGGSAALAVGARWRLLGEVVAELGDGPAAWSAGPGARLALGPTSSLAAGALLDLRNPAGPPTFVLQLTQGL